MRMASEREYATSEAARLLVRARWGSRGVDQAVETICRRADELTAAQLAEVAAALDAQKDVSGDE